MGYSSRELRDLVLQKVPALSEIILDALIEGVERSSLDMLLDGNSLEERQLSRMNLIGGLRSMGFQISGGRGGGGTLYRVFNWREPAVPTSASEWSDEDRQRLEDIQRDPVLMRDEPKVLRLLLKAISWGIVPPDAHEAGTLQLYSYDLGSAHTSGFWNEDRSAIIIKRFHNRPVFRIRPLTLNPEGAVALCQYLSSVSLRPVRVDSVSETYARQVANLLDAPSVIRNRQAVIDLGEAASMSDKIFSSRTRSYLRKYSREDTYVSVVGRSSAPRMIIDEWRTVSGMKQRQLSINRDYVADEADIPKFCFLGFRSDHPVCVHIIERTSETMCTQIVEKSLNYRGSPGGGPGTTDWNFYSAACRLWDLGLREFNLGMIDGGTTGLADHKVKMMKRQVDIWSVSSNLRRAEDKFDLVDSEGIPGFIDA